MKIAITGGTGFVGSHLAKRLVSEGHRVVAISRGTHDATDRLPGVAYVAVDVSDPVRLAEALAGCDGIAHCAGINREIGSQTYRRVHIEGTRNVVEAARRAGVRKIVLMSFLRARARCGSPYHESKWAAEELVRGSGLDFCVVKAGMTYGHGDHMLDHLSRSLHTMPMLLTVGCREKGIRPLAIEDLVEVLRAALLHETLSRRTIALMGPEQLMLSAAVRRVARVLGRRVFIMPAPRWVHEVLSRVFEWSMTTPLVAEAQVRILAEGVLEAATACDPLPAELVPRRAFTEDRIRAGLPAPGPYTIRDLRPCAR